MICPVLVGREPELGTLGANLAADRPTLLIGEAGVGKTTLMRAAAAASGRKVFEGGALATLSWMECLPLRRALGRELGAGDASTVAAEVQSKVRSGVLVVDDLQWADAATIDALILLAGRTGILAGVRLGDPGAGPVTDQLLGAGFAALEVAPLPPDSSSELVRSLRPDLTPAAVESLVRRTGGNPLLLNELVTTGEPSASLRLMLAARLRLLDVAGREAFGLLALAGRPLPAGVLGKPGVKSLLDIGLGVVDPLGIAVRHALLAEIALEQFDLDERMALHARLARAVDDDGEAARHYASAGETGRAHDAAMRAADTAERPGERASHLAIAARCASGPEADALRLRAARALDEAHDWDAMVSVLDQLTSDEVEVRAWASLLRARGAWAAGDVDGLRTALSDGLAVARGSGTDVEVRLRIEESRIPIFIDCDLAEGVRMSRAALSLAQATGVEVPRAEYLLGTALAVADVPGGWDHLAAAISGARRDGDTNTEFVAANNLISYHESGGSPAEGRAVAAEMIDRATGLGLGYWATAFQTTVVNLDFHAGGYAQVVTAAQGLLQQPLEARSRDILIEDLAMSLLDLGRVDEAVRLVTASQDAAAPDYRGREQMQWVLAEAALWGGHPARALELIERYLDPKRTDPNRNFGVVTRAWALVELERDPGPAAPPQDRPMLFGVPEETAALQLLFQQRYAEAAARFDRAADLWAPYHRRGDLRCGWAAGETLRRAGDNAAAIARLIEVESASTGLGATLILARIHRSLRAAGQRRSAPRSANNGGLTDRERQVLDLVRTGLTNEAIATQLGISRRTVVALVSSASTKLGATGRNHAASLSAELR
jgi:DNA-binding CsgD family transcriptional regulator